MKTNRALSRFVLARVTLVACLANLARSGEVHGFEISAAIVPTNSIQLSFPAETSAYYQIWHAQAVTSEAWSVMALDLGAGGVKQWTHTGAVNTLDGVHYRVRAIPLDMPDDVDADGIDDVFELQSGFLDPMNNFDSLGDQDADFFINVTEYQRGSALTNAASVPLQVQITAPSDGAMFTEPATIAIAADVAVLGSSVSQVIFSTWAPLGTDNAAPYGFTWNNVVVGSYTIKAVALDAEGLAATDTVSVTVGLPPNDPPTVSLTGPANGSTYTIPTTANIQANANDPNGNLDRVEFYVDGQLIGSDSIAPFEYTWRDLCVGSYSIYARAIDDMGEEDTSGTITVHVQKPAPSASFAAHSVGGGSGSAEFYRDGTAFYSKFAYDDARGFNVMAFDPAIGALLAPVQSYDQWSVRHSSGAPMNNMKSFINGLPNGTLIMIAVADEAGITYFDGEGAGSGFPGFSDCDQLDADGHPWVEPFLVFLEDLGSTKIRDYCYQDSWVFAAIKGTGVALAEKHNASGSRISIQHSLGISPLENQFDLVNSMITHRYFDGSNVYNNDASGGLNCNSSTDQVCGFINDHHAHVLRFSSSIAYQADGMVFRGRLDQSQFEHMYVAIHGDPAPRWNEWSPSRAGQDVWYEFTVPGPFEIRVGNNDVELYTEHFPDTGSSDGSIHLQPKDGDRSWFRVYTSDGDDDNDCMPDAWERQYGLDPLNPDDAFYDRDGDGINNLGEWNSGTSP